MKLGVSTYSYWHFRGPKLPLKEYIEMAWRDGFDGVEVLVNHVESRSRSYLRSIRRLSLRARPHPRPLLGALPPVGGGSLLARLAAGSSVTARPARWAPSGDGPRWRNPAPSGTGR